MATRFTFFDFITVSVVTLIAVSLTAMSLPSMVASAREKSCSNNLRRVGLGFHNYHAAYNRLPMGSGGTSSGSESAPLLDPAMRQQAIDFARLTRGQLIFKLDLLIANPPPIRAELSTQIIDNRIKLPMADGGLQAEVFDGHWRIVLESTRRQYSARQTPG